MKPRLRTDARPLDLFQAQFDQILNLDHPLVVLAGQIDWNRFGVATRMPIPLIRFVQEFS